VQEDKYLVSADVFGEMPRRIWEFEPRSLCPLRRVSTHADSCLYMCDGMVLHLATFLQWMLTSLSFGSSRRFGVGILVFGLGGPHTVPSIRVDSGNSTSMHLQDRDLHPSNTRLLVGRGLRLASIRHFQRSRARQTLQRDKMQTGPPFSYISCPISALAIHVCFFGIAISILAAPVCSFNFTPPRTGTVDHKNCAFLIFAATEMKTPEV